MKANKLLLIEDDIILRRSLKALLKNDGYNVTTAETAEEAFDLLEIKSFEFILSDNILPGINGLELLKIAKNEHPDSIRLLLTGNPDISVLEQAINEGEIYRFIKKPVRFSELSHIVKQAGEFYDLRRQNIEFLKTLEKKVEERSKKLFESEKKLRTLFETMVQGVIYVDTKCKITSANPSTEKILGIPLKKLIGKPAFNSSWKAIQQDDSKLLENKDPLSLSLKTGKEVKDIIVGVFNPLIKNYRWINVNVLPQFNNGENQPYQAYATFEDITEQKKSEEELKYSKKELQDFSRHLLSIRENERTKIAREIHDELGQTLTALKMDISMLETKIENRVVVKDKISSIYKLIDSTIKTVQKISSELRPGVLDNLGLDAAIEWQTNEFQKRTNIDCRLSLDNDSISQNGDVSTIIFRIFQEALTNVARHTNASKVDILLKEENGNVILKISDNGIGITEEAISNSKSLGLIGIRERVYSVGGEVQISGAKGKGTNVTVTVPIQKSKQYDKNTISR